MGWSAAERAGVVAGVVLGVGLGAVALVGAEPEVPALGHAERVAGVGGPVTHGHGYSGDGFAATKARLGHDVKIGVAADGALLVADSSNRRLRRVGADGVIDTVPAPAAVGDGGPWFADGAIPRAADGGPDGSVYLSDHNRIGRLGKDGSWAVAGRPISAPVAPMAPVATADPPPTRSSMEYGPSTSTRAVRCT